MFAIGDLLDLTQPWVPSRGLRYYLLSRASLCLDPVLESPTVTALQAMVALATFNVLSTLTRALAFASGISHVVPRSKRTRARVGAGRDQYEVSIYSQFPLHLTLDRRRIIEHILQLGLRKYRRHPSQGFTDLASCARTRCQQI